MLAEQWRKDKDSSAEQRNGPYEPELKIQDPVVEKMRAHPNVAVVASKPEEKLARGVWRCSHCRFKMYDALDDDKCTNCYTRRKKQELPKELPKELP